jgi:hypothetical protein
MYDAILTVALVERLKDTYRTMARLCEAGSVDSGDEDV